MENNHGYVLVHEEAPVMGLRIYELDLQSWQWRCVPGLNIDFQLDPDEDTIATALIQVQDATCMVNPCCMPLFKNVNLLDKVALNQDMPREWFCVAMQSAALHNAFGSTLAGLCLGYQ